MTNRSRTGLPAIALTSVTPFQLTTRSMLSPYMGGQLSSVWPGTG